MTNDDSQPLETRVLAAMIDLLTSKPDNDSTAEAIDLSDADSQQIIDWSRRHRVVPLLADAVDAGRIKVAAPIAEQLAATVGGIMSATVELEDRALSAIAVLEGAGIDVRVLKGLATAHLDYPNPALRQFGDADLLVRPAQFEHAVAALADAGHPRKLAIRGNRWQTQHAVTIDIDGFELDLHHRLLHQVAGHQAAALDLFAESEPYHVAGQRLLALPSPLRLLQAAGQNVLSARIDAKSSSDVDVHLLMDAASEAYDMANAAGLGWMLDLGLASAARAAGLRPPTPRSANTVTNRYLHRVYSSAAPSASVLAAAEAAVAPPAVTARTLWSIISPGAEYLTARDRSQWDQIRHQIDRLNVFRPTGRRIRAGLRRRDS